MVKVKIDNKNNNNKIVMFAVYFVNLPKKTGICQL